MLQNLNVNKAMKTNDETYCPNMVVSGLLKSSLLL